MVDLTYPLNGYAGTTSRPLHIRAGYAGRSTDAQGVGGL